MSDVCIGLFGTCGSSLWREDFINKYKATGKNYFNPVVTDWNPSFAKVEASHLANDSIILFPVLEETYAFGSISEIGFSILQTLRLDDRRDVVVLIRDYLTDDLMENDAGKAKDSLKARALVYEHLKKLQLPNVYLVDTLDEMLEVSLILYNNQKDLLVYKNKFNPHLRSY